MTLELVFANDVFTAPYRYLRAHRGEYVLVPQPRGEDGPVPSAYYSADGTRFEPSAFDLSAIDPGPTPVLDSVCERERAETTADGRLLYMHEYGVVEGRLGPNISLTKSRYTAPERFRFRQCALTTAHGRWWAGGHLSADSAKGMLFRSDDDGASWVLAGEKLPGSVGVLVPSENGLHAMAFRSVLAVEVDGITEIAKYKDEVWHVFVDARGIFGFGEQFAAFTPGPGKRQKYAALPAGGGGRACVCAVQNGFVLGRIGGLWTSTDAMSWKAVDAFQDHLVPSRTRRDVRAIVPCRDGALVQSSDGEVFFTRID